MKISPGARADSDSRHAPLLRGPPRASRRAREHRGIWSVRLIATNQFQADLLWRGYVMGEQEQFTPAPGQTGLTDRILNLIASKVCLSTDELHAFLDLTYLGFQQRDKRPSASDHISDEAERALGVLVDAQLVNRSEDGRLEASRWERSPPAKAFARLPR